LFAETHKEGENMFDIVDLHNHSLYGLDDGADSYEKMCQMIDCSYRNGVRHICFTPHYHNIGNRDCTPEKIGAVYNEARRYCAEHYPDLRLSVGSEMVYHFDCIDAIAEKRVLTLSESRYVLTDFLASPDARGIMMGVERLLGCGYFPVVAHVERYDCLLGKVDEVRRLSDAGAVIQINAGSLNGGIFSKKRKFCMKLLEEELVDVVASDAHNTDSRPPSLDFALKTVVSKFGEEYAERIFRLIPEKIMSNQRM